MIELRKFRNKYDLELLLNSDEKMKIGDLFRDSILNKPVEDDDISVDVWRLLEKAEILSDSEKDEYRQQSENIEYIDANLSNIDKKIEFEFDLGLSVLKKLNLGNIQLSYNDVENFSFSNIRKKEITNDLAETISDYIDKFRNNNWGEYKRVIRRAFFITELYYGDITVKINENINISADAVISETGLEITPKFSNGVLSSFTISSQKIPFAMKLASIKKFDA